MKYEFAVAKFYRSLFLTNMTTGDVEEFSGQTLESVMVELSAQGWLIVAIPAPKISGTFSEVWLQRIAKETPTETPTP